MLPNGVQCHSPNNFERCSGDELRAQEHESAVQPILLSGGFMGLQVYVLNNEIELAVVPELGKDYFVKKPGVNWARVVVASVEGLKFLQIRCDD